MTTFYIHNQFAFYQNLKTIKGKMLNYTNNIDEIILFFSSQYNFCHFPIFFLNLGLFFHNYRTQLII